VEQQADPHLVAAHLVRNSVHAEFNGTEESHPVVVESEHWEGTPGYFGVMWEEGPDEWVYDHEAIKVPEEYFVEPVDHYTLGVYPK
jgi:hypothetical protein